VVYLRQAHLAERGEAMSHMSHTSHGESTKNATGLFRRLTSFLFASRLSVSATALVLLLLTSSGGYAGFILHNLFLFLA